jgi:hypothetical protein
MVDLLAMTMLALDLMLPAKLSLWVRKTTAWSLLLRTLECPAARLAVGPVFLVPPRLPLKILRSAAPHPFNRDPGVLPVRWELVARKPVLQATAQYTELTWRGKRDARATYLSKIAFVCTTLLPHERHYDHLSRLPTYF